MPKFSTMGANELLKRLPDATEADMVVIRARVQQLRDELPENRWNAFRDEFIEQAKPYATLARLANSIFNFGG